MKHCLSCLIYHVTPGDRPFHYGIPGNQHKLPNITMERQNASAAWLACEARRFLRNLSALRSRQIRYNERQSR